MSAPFRAIVVIPTYNECDNIESLISTIVDLKIGIEILVVDDNSPDGTAKIVARLQQYYAYPIHLLRQSKKQGLGRAYLAGFGWLLHYNYDYICTMDADFSHTPADLIHLLVSCSKKNIDITIGSRYIAGSDIINWPFSRMVISRLANWIARWMTGLSIQDITAGFICYRRSMLAHVLQIPIHSIGYGFQVEMKFLAHQHGARLVEYPITFTNRTHGISKMKISATGGDFLRLLQMKWKSWLRKRQYL